MRPEPPESCPERISNRGSRPDAVPGRGHTVERGLEGQNIEVQLLVEKLHQPGAGREMCARIMVGFAEEDNSNIP
jgi:hypothetical protein